ncbi:MAG: NAD(+)/NADH kinase [Thaumarchaeota archaeon]|nr:NAD(+)/NADH kinase [Nitrososphaerota archaeon]
MKARLLLDGGSPKVPPGELKKIVQDSRIEVSQGRADFGIVLGGDGRFSRYGRTEDMPLLFVGVRSKGATGSKAHLARTTFDELPEALAMVRSGKYRIDEHKRLGVLKNGKALGEVFTDVYLQRGSESTCVRYNVKVTGPRIHIEEAAIGDGVVVTTQAGSTGYYSYPDRVKGEWMDPTAFANLGRDEVGICHVVPTFTERTGTVRHPLRYTVPWGSRIDVSLFREADARLYGIADNHIGIKIKMGDTVSVVAGKKVTRLISFN